MDQFLSHFVLDWWVVVGLIGQSLFFMRMILQWVYSEVHKQSLIPVAYWYLSIAGGLITLVYAYHRKDVVFFIGQIIALFIYFRNIYLSKTT